MTDRERIEADVQKARTDVVGWILTAKTLVADCEQLLTENKRLSEALEKIAKANRSEPYYPEETISGTVVKTSRRIAREALASRPGEKTA